MNEPPKVPKRTPQQLAVWTFEAALVEAVARGDVSETVALSIVERAGQLWDIATRSRRTT